MTDTQLYEQALTILGLDKESKEVKVATVQQMVRLTQSRLASVVPSLLTDDQAEHIVDMQSAGKTPEEIMQWAEAALPVKYRELFEATMLDAAEEIVSNRRTPAQR
ncbi:MAG TPA: hypothetical protein VFT53_02200 [Candidatus Saccharimonadales bacterium]|nr:hypothetical protein [Candidatus Saccharimonadales bacterium]